MGPEEAVSYVPLIDVALDPTGRWVAVVPREVDAHGERAFRTWIGDLDRDTWTLLGGPDAVLGQPAFSPDGGSVAVVREVEEGAHVAVFDLRRPSGPFRAHLDGPRAPRHLQWSRAGLACIGLDEAGRRRLYAWWGNEVRIATPPGHVVGDFAMAGDRFAWIGTTPERRIHVAVRDGGLRVVEVDHVVLGRLGFAPDGHRLGYVAVDRSDRPSEIRLWVIDTRDAVPRPVCRSAGVEGRAGSWDWTPEGDLVVAMETGTCGHLVRLGEGAPQILGPTDRFLSGPTSDRARGRLIFASQDLHDPQHLDLREPDGSIRQLTTFNAGLQPLAPGRTVRWSSDDGLEVEGVLVGEGDGPLLVWLHGGPDDHVHRTFSPYFQVLAGAGYRVLAPNYRGSSGRDEAFLCASIGDLTGGDLGDVRAGAAHLVATGEVRPGPVGVVGWHYGGTLALAWARRFPEEVAALVVGAPIVDFLSTFGAIADPAPLQRYFPTSWLVDRRPLDEVSPISHIAQMRVPTLILQGRSDGVVPLSQAMLLYRALRARGVPVDAGWYVDEGHIPQGVGAVRDLLSRSLAWFDQHLPR